MLKKSNSNFTQYLTRKATIRDVKSLQSIAIRSYQEYENVLTKDNWNILWGKLSDIQTFIELVKKAQCFVCQSKEEIIGVAYYLIPSGNPTHVFKEEWSYIRMVGVDPNFRGKGISKQLTQHCIDFAKSNNESIIALHTSEFMNAARHIYEDLGFSKTKELKPIFGKKYWLYLKKLN